MTKDFDRKSVALNLLAVWEGNVRKTGADQDLGDLMASIEAHGLLNPLHVFDKGKGTYVVAGQRRLLALQKLANAKKIDKDYAVPCIVVDMADALEISLAENTIRADMHPADQFEAFAALADKEMPIADIAARFGVTERIVNQRLRLGRVHPALLAEYRDPDSDLNLDELEAFALTDDQDAQLIIRQQLGGRATAWRIREALTKDEVPFTDKRARFVGVAAYEAAGGIVRRDLFDDRESGYLIDAQLLNRLVSEKMKEAVASVQAEGWKWVEEREQLTWSEKQKFGEDKGKKPPLTFEQKSALDDLQKELAELEEIDNEDGLSDEQEARKEEVEDAIDKIDNRTPTFSKAAYARGGAVIVLDYDGTLEITRGLIRKADMPKDKKAKDGKEADEPEKPAFSQSLLTDLKDYTLDAIQVELAEDPDTALIAVVYSLAIRRTSKRYGWNPLALDAKPQRVPDDATGRAYIETLASDKLEGMPTAPADLWHWLGLQTREKLMDMLAALVGPLVNRSASSTKQIRKHLEVDVRKHFTPTAANYFGKISAEQIMADLKEMGQTETDLKPLAKLKKKELALYAEKIAASDFAWLPEPMRDQPLDEDELADTEEADDWEGIDGDEDDMDEAA
ncbi:ParB/RepB/Spo0J family partition protein [Methylobacterium sp. 1030]|uniref:ParB/RepB/Spo0J family partition protein n=1 Tax=Methylobacterium sp. 1030 TaxID=3156404 RepID=UPI0033977E28